MYRIHDDPPGISGWLVEGRTIYDCFVLNEKRNGIYYHGGQSVFKNLDAMSAATSVGGTTLIINGVLGASGNKWYYDLATTAGGLESITYGTAITTANWTEMKDASNNPINYVNLASGTVSTNKFARIIETDSSGYPLAFADVIINVGA